MMNLTTLSLSFWGYALESATCILDMVPTKKVDKTPYQLWYGKVPSLSYLKNLKKFKMKIHHLLKTLAKFLWRGFEPPQEEVVPVCRSARIHRAPDCFCLNVEVEEHSLRNFNEPANYKAAILDPEYDKRLDAMNAEMQSMKDNQVWCLVDIPPNCKTVGSKWIFKKKTDMDSIVHTYKARLIAKGFAQTYEVNYEETISPVADIRAIRILIAIATFYDWEATFILRIKIYRDRSKRLIGLSQSAYMDKILKKFRMDNSKHGEPHWTVGKTILKYLRNTKDMFLVYGGNPEAELRVDCYCYAGFETDRDDIKSQTGYVFILNGGVVDWKSSKQSTTAMSATEAEYIAASESTMEAVWISKFISGLVRVDDNLADPFTKALAKGKLTQHARSMGLHLASSFM
ncbi:retrotransposon protein, putative, ty1-copia subclass [Tanacetum coccineum]